MTATVSKRRPEHGGPAHPDVFMPGGGDIASGQTWDGKRREIAPRSADPLLWPTTSKARFELFDTWHDVAMQLVHREKGSFRLLAVTKKVIHWKTGTITMSNAGLAERAGFCSDKTITRDVEQGAKLGIFVVSMGWRKEGTQVVRTRIIRLALPAIFPPGIHLPDEPFDRDMSGPDGEGGDRDNSGPGDRDNSGPITMCNHKGAAPCS